MRTDDGEEQLSYRFLGDSCRVRSRADRWKKKEFLMRGDAHQHLGESTLESYLLQATRSLFCSIW